MDKESGIPVFRKDEGSDILMAGKRKRMEVDELLDDEPCSYYGEMGGEKPAESACSYVVDEAYLRILEKHQEKLGKEQAVMIAELRKTFRDDIRMFNAKVEDVIGSISDVSRRLDALEKRLGENHATEVKGTDGKAVRNGKKGGA
jgi:hypothetical protein